jgi:membrane-associated protein
LESGVFFALPGDSLLFTAGLLASTVGLDLYFLIPLIFLGTFLGGLAGYSIGKNLDRLDRYPIFKKILKPEHIKKAHIFFEKHGKAAILFSRFIPIIRTFMPIAAGIARMEYASFVRYSLVSSVLWSTIVTLAGFFLGRSFPFIKDYLSYVIVVVVFVSVLPGVLEWIRNRKKNES